MTFLIWHHLVGAALWLGGLATLAVQPHIGPEVRFPDTRNRTSVQKCDSVEDPA